MSGGWEDSAFIAAQIERALYRLTLAVEESRQQDFASKADRN